MAKRQDIETNGILTDADLAAYCPDLTEWPSIWHYEARDLIPGENIVAVFKPFLFHLLGQGLSRKTRNRHRDNLWLLGGDCSDKRRRHTGYFFQGAANTGLPGQLLDLIVDLLNVTAIAVPHLLS